MITAACLQDGDDGWSRYARLFFAAWERQEEVRIVHLNDLPSPSSQAANGPVIGLGPIEPMANLVGSPRIAYVMWETTVLPADKAAILKSFDQVWVPSTWQRDLFVANGIAADRLHVVPAGVDVDRFRPVERRCRPERPFRFLFVGKWEERKGVDLLIKAYRREFSAKEPVELVLHAWNPYVRGFDLDASIRRASGWRAGPRIVGSWPVDEDAMIRLYSDCDAFVLTSRAEGWGLPITEAMACALPVIVTAYSAPLDYLDPDVAYLVDVRKLVPVRDPYFFPSGRALGQWALPDIGSLRRHLRHVYDHREEAREKGRRARVRVSERWTWDHAVATARHILRDAPRP